MSCVGLDEAIRLAESGPLGRILKSADFKLVLARPSTTRSPHFALHYASAFPTRTRRVSQGASQAELSTGGESAVDRPVDILCPVDLQTNFSDAFDLDCPVEETPELSISGRPPIRVWIGLVVPKRHAKRSVTRTLMKRQMRVALENAGERLEPGMWVVRLRAPFGKVDYPSAASVALKQVVREELASLMARGVRQRVRTS